MKMNHKTKIGVLIVCTAGIITIWRVTNVSLSLEAGEENEKEEKNIEQFTKWTEKLKTTNNDTNKSCSCATCMSEYNEFFMKRYDKSVNPFLTPQENLTQDDYRWWSTLQYERGGLIKFKEAKDRIFKLFPTRLDLTEPGPDRCRTCAVVGNSGNLKGSKYGSQIDAHDIVIRMNGGITKGYEEDVGTKTTHRVMYPESAINLDNNTHLVLFAFKIMDLRWLVEAFTTGFYGRSYAPIISRIIANKNLVMVVNPAFMKYVHKSWLSGRGGYPSTGFMTLVLSLHICDEVKVFGFGADKNGNWFHYWEVLRNTNLKTGLHPGMAEYGLIQELAKQKKVTFVKGW